MYKLYDICIIGLGPAGIGFISSLGKGILQNSICFEKGNEKTICNCYTESKCSKCSQCSIVSGLGGASKFSCGKISNFPAGSGLLPFWDSQKNALVDFLNSQIEILNKNLNLSKINIPNEKIIRAKKLFDMNGIEYKYYDVYEYQKDEYISYISSIVNKAKTNGLIINYDTVVTQIDNERYKKNDVFLITAEGKNGTSKCFAKKVVIATGNINDNSQLFKNITNKKPQTSYELGVRINVPTNRIIDFLDCHGDLKLKYKNGRTYCVSKNGYIIAYSVNDALYLEGCVDKSPLSNMTNLAVLFKYDDYSVLKDIKDTYRNVYNGIPIKQTYNDYVNNRVSYLDFSEKHFPVQQGKIMDLFPDKVNDSIIDFIESVLIRTIKLSPKDLIIYAPELKETNIFEINSDFQITNNIFVIGASTGKFRGVLQSMCSGIHCANIMVR